MPLLSLTRRYGQRTILTLPDGQRIVITPEPVSAKEKVKLMFDAPAEVRIVREEVLHRTEEGVK